MSTQTSNYAQIHRFGDSVAVYFSGHETVYMSPAMAERLSMELVRYVREVEAGVRFSESKVGTLYIDGEGRDVR